MSIVSASNLEKRYQHTKALDGFSMTVEPGHIVGLIGPNGSGKTTALKAMLGLNKLNGGSLLVQGLNPSTDRHALMQNTSYIADTGTLPRWMRINDLLDYVAGVHPLFDQDIANRTLATTNINRQTKVRALSKGMQVQLHLAIVLAIQAKLLVLDEPTLGLDIIYRQHFYDSLLNDYFNEQRSIVITTHEVREIEHILTDVVFIDQGKARLTLSMQDLDAHFIKLVSNEVPKLPNHSPLASKKTLRGVESIYQGVEQQILQPFGETTTPNLAELFVAVVRSGENV